jgi:aminoglycoside phosphotransferase (APT) family kinase protein
MPEEAPPADIAEPLIRYLRDQLAAPSLEYSAAPQALTGGFDTSVYAFALANAAPPFDVPLVVRVFGPQDREIRAPYEASIQGAVAGQGFPAPAVLHICREREALGGAFLIMTRASGTQLVDSLFSPSVLKVPAVLARLHGRLHRLDIEPVRDALAAAGAPGLPTIPGDALARHRRDLEAAGLTSLEPALAWLETHVPRASRANVLCHGDFHPLNILAEGLRVTGVVDWGNAAAGPAAADIGVTRVILTMGPIDVPGWARGPVNLFRRWATWRYTSAYRRLNPVPMEDVAYFEAMRCFAAMLNVARIRTQSEPALRTGYAWDSPEAVRAMTRHFRKVSGVPLRLPRGPHPAGRASASPAPGEGE